MPKMFINDSNTVRQLAKVFVNDGGTVREAQRVWALEGTTPRLVFTSQLPGWTFSGVAGMGSGGFEVGFRERDSTATYTSFYNLNPSSTGWHVATTDAWRVNVNTPQDGGTTVTGRPASGTRGVIQPRDSEGLRLLQTIGADRGNPSRPEDGLIIINPNFSPFNGIIEVGAADTSVGRLSGRGPYNRFEAAPGDFAFPFNSETVALGGDTNESAGGSLSLTGYTAPSGFPTNPHWSITPVSKSVNDNLGGASFPGAWRISYLSGPTFNINTDLQVQVRQNLDLSELRVTPVGGTERPAVASDFEWSLGTIPILASNPRRQYEVSYTTFENNTIQTLRVTQEDLNTFIGNPEIIADPTPGAIRNTILIRLRSRTAGGYSGRIRILEGSGCGVSRDAKLTFPLNRPATAPGHALTPPEFTLSRPATTVANPIPMSTVRTVPIGRTAAEARDALATTLSTVLSGRATRIQNRGFTDDEGVDFETTQFSYDTIGLHPDVSFTINNNPLNLTNGTVGNLQTYVAQLDNNSTRVQIVYRIVATNTQVGRTLIFANGETASEIVTAIVADAQTVPALTAVRTLVRANPMDPTVLESSDSTVLEIQNVTVTRANTGNNGGTVMVSGSAG